MKRIAIAVLVVIAFPLSSAAQTETLLGLDAEFGGWGGPSVRFTQILDGNGLMVGGQGACVINKTISIGGGGYGLTTRHILSDGTNDYRLGFGYGGLLLEYLRDPDELIHFYAECLFAIGGVSFSEEHMFGAWGDGESSDTVFVVEPAVNICLNVQKYFRVAVGAGYRYLQGLNEGTKSRFGIEDSDLTGYEVNITFRFGKY